MTLSATQSTPEFQAYARAREAVLRMKERATPASVAHPSEYWAAELENIDYMVEASPLIVRKLRHHAFHITGLRPYDYRDKQDGRREHFEARLRQLMALGGEALLVAESPALGGFGYEIDGRLFNVDTLKFYEVLIGMERAGVLGQIRDAARPVVCEIGAGWGGFAYQFKTLFPDTTYVIVDFPELFLFSATYLGALFPGTRMQFVSDTGGAIEEVGTTDFLFVPHTLAETVSRLPLKLAVNMVSFQEMTGAQVREYARLAADARCPHLYSLNRERSPYNSELSSVSAALSERYVLQDVKVLDTDYVSATKKPPKPGKPADPSALGYRHLHGRLKSGGSDAPRVVLGMTLYNKAEYLREAMDSLLAQSYPHFALVLLDDASSDATETIAREYAARDPRVRYFRHASRAAMIATWREVVELAIREYPSAEYFAWVSDHDRWDPGWLDELLARLDAHPEAVLAYPVTQRMTPAGDFFDKGPRLFDTAGMTDLWQRWRHFCEEGVGSGDMVYGLMRVAALRKAGVFRTVLRPDRLLIAELTLQGQIHQVPKRLWFRRMFEETSIARQRETLVLPESRPPHFGRPPWFQHAAEIHRVYAVPGGSGSLTQAEWRRLIARYLVSYAWRHFRKTETSHWLARSFSRVVFAKKLLKHYYHHAVYHTLVGARVAWGRTRRFGRRARYEVLMLTHRLGLRGGSGGTTP